MSLHFPLPEILTFRFSLQTSHLTLLKCSPLWRWNSQWVLTFRCQKFRPLLFVPTLSSGAIVLPIEKMTQIIIGSVEALPISLNSNYYRKRGSAFYIVREVRSVRERERERERDASDVTLVTLKLAMNFAPFLAKNLHLSIGEEFCTFPFQNLHLRFSPLEWRWAHTFRCTLPGTLCGLRLASGVTGDRSKQTIEYPAALSFFSSKKWIKLIPKTIGNRKRDCAWGCARGINTTWENLQIKKPQIRKAFFPLTGLICAFRSADFLRWCLSPERNLTHNLFFYFQ